MTRIGFIGAGRMGSPMVGRLIETGHRVLVLGRDDEKRRAIAELGATPVSEPTDAVASAEVVVICAFTDDQVRAIATPQLLEAIPAGATLVIHTTGSPGTSAVIAASAPHIGVLDAPVSGGPHDIVAGRLTVFAGGSAADLTRAYPVLSSYAEPVLHVGPLGAGQQVKLVNNTIFAAQIGLLAAAVRLAEQLGIDESALLTALTHGSGAGRVLENVVRAGSTASFISAVGEFVGKDVAVLRSTAAELGISLGALDPVVDLAVSRPPGEAYS